MQTEWFTKQIRTGEYITGSVCDAVFWHSHHFRCIHGQVMTTVNAGQYETPIKAENLLLGVDKHHHVHRVSDNPLNFTREALSLTPSKRSNTWIPHGDVTYLITCQANTILLDTDMVDKVRNYVWSSRVSNGKVTIYTRSRIGGVTKRYTLWRLLLDVPHGSNATVHFQNNDPFDLRRTNLRIISSETPS